MVLHDPCNDNNVDYQGHNDHHDDLYNDKIEEYRGHNDDRDGRKFVMISRHLIGDAWPMAIAIGDDKDSNSTPGTWCAPPVK